MIAGSAATVWERSPPPSWNNTTPSGRAESAGRATRIGDRRWLTRRCDDAREQPDHDGHASPMPSVNSAQIAARSWSRSRFVATSAQPTGGSISMSVFAASAPIAWVSEVWSRCRPSSVRVTARASVSLPDAARGASPVGALTVTVSSDQ
jgi:hypothetical protein